MFKRLVTLLITTGITVSVLTGCTTAPENEAKPLYKEMVTTICSLNDKSVINETDVKKFRSLAKKMETYTGYNQESIHKAAKQVDGIANTYESVIGVELGEDVKETHVKSCETVKAQYEKTFGDN